MEPTPALHDVTDPMSPAPIVGMSRSSRQGAYTMARSSRAGAAHPVQEIGSALSSYHPAMPVLVSSLVLAAMLGEPWTCPPDLCVDRTPEPRTPVHGRVLRRMMRAFGPIRGRDPVFFTVGGTPLSPSMSISRIERRVRADGFEDEPAFRMLYGRCVSHDETCPSAEVELRLHGELDALDCDSPEVARVTRTKSHVVVEYRAEGTAETFEVGVGPGRCTGETLPASTESVHSTWIMIDGTHGMARAVLGRLPVRAITRALAREG